MEYHVFDPHPCLKPFIRCIWMVTGNSRQVQKVIGDGCPELIFHFGDPYHIENGGKWQKQALTLVAGQMDKPILLEPSGESGVVGIKFNPTGLWRLFGWNMQSLVNEVQPLANYFSTEIESLQKQIQESGTSHTARIALIENFILKRLKSMHHSAALDPLLKKIFEEDDRISISRIAKDFKMSTRK